MTTAPDFTISNKAPALAWRGGLMACGTRRQRLFLDETETPFFIDSARGIRAHRSSGEEHGLYGAGMGAELRPGTRIAAPLGCGPNVRLLKHRAEQMALQRVPA